MSDISFYPGPSRVFSKVPEYIYDAYMDNILAINHRSEEYMSLDAKTKDLLKSKLLIPDDYEIVFLSSATESWEILAQSTFSKKSQHFHNGAFGEKWASYTEKITHNVLNTAFDVNEKIPIDKVDENCEWICITQNETSNGTEISLPELKDLRKNTDQNQMIAVDVTSSMGGIFLEFQNADVWFASVQKCFGLPAGMAIMILSPAAVAKAYDINERNHYNSLPFVLDNSRKNQTHYTPNILDIYLLYRSLNNGHGIKNVHDKVMGRYKNWLEVISDIKRIDWLIENEDVRSKTVLALACENPAKIKQKAKNAQLVLGDGYGKWKDNSIRIANFPAIKGKEIQKLINFLKRKLD